MERPLHQPVMVCEVIEYLAPRDRGVYFDGTVGMGGHAAVILEASGPGGLLIGADLDASAVAAAEENLSKYTGRVKIYHANYTQLEYISGLASVRVFDGILLDLGIGSHQLDAGDRGFSLDLDGPLDMRFDTGEGKTAGQIVNGLSEKELARILDEYGEERRARAAARAIVRARQNKRIETTRELAAIVARAIGPAGRWRIHPATRTFMALRIYVNGELENLQRFIDESSRFLAPAGRMVVISFHSLEDRIVKNSFRELSRKGDDGRDAPFTVMTKKPVSPNETEIARNPRARSAKLRAIQRIPDG
jgi:16S rRNA (cytosine1402-N4)-methyltransferase